MTSKNNEGRSDAVISDARHRVLVALKRLAPATIRELADALAMNGPAVRHHLTALQDVALVELASEKVDRPIPAGGGESGQANFGGGVGSGQASSGGGVGSGQASSGGGVGNGQANSGGGVGSGQASSGGGVGSGQASSGGGGESGQASSGGGGESGQVDRGRAVSGGTRGRGRGRPAQRWRLTPAAAAYLPDGHAELTIGLIEATRDAVGGAGLEAILARRGQQQVERYRAAMASAASLLDRAAVLARLRTAEGYLAEAFAEPDGAVILIEHHCPICDAARACAGLCANELEVFRAVLAPAHVERTQHLLAGAARCVYRVTPESTTGSS